MNFDFDFNPSNLLERVAVEAVIRAASALRRRRPNKPVDY